MSTTDRETEKTQEVTRVSSERRVEGGTWVIDPTMIVSAAAGIYLLVIGIVAVARAGFIEGSLFSPVINVGGLEHTPLLGLIEIGFGLLVLAAGTLSRNPQAVTFLGVVALIIGIVWVVEAQAFQEYLGVTSANGWQHVIMGTILAASAQVTPFTVDRPGSR